MVQILFYNINFISYWQFTKVSLIPYCMVMETFNFLTFSGGIALEHWAKIG